jgi:hypothetical protein
MCLPAERGPLDVWLALGARARQKFPTTSSPSTLPRVPSGKVNKDALRARAKAIAEAGEPARRLDGTR